MTYHRAYRRTVLALTAGAALTLSASLAGAQATQPPAKPDDHAAMHAEHMKRMQQGDKSHTWKELDAYHGLMMATWHPAKDKNDMAPTRRMIGSMVTSAKAVAASKAPAGCQKPELLKAQAGLVGETEKVQKLVDAKADDTTLKAAMKALHDAFEVLEEGCNTGMKH